MRILLYEHSGSLEEALAILGGPPICETTVAIKSGALIVETMADFVSNHGANCAVVGRRIALRVEERILKNSRGEHDFVEARVVIGVHRLRGHEPLVAVNGLAELLHLATQFELRRRLNVPDKVRCVNLEIGVIAPFHRVANFGGEFGELVESSLLSGH